MQLCLRTYSICCMTNKVKDLKRNMEQRSIQFLSPAPDNLQTTESYNKFYVRKSSPKNPGILSCESGRDLQTEFCFNSRELDGDLSPGFIFVSTTNTIIYKTRSACSTTCKPVTAIPKTNVDLVGCYYNQKLN